MTILYCHRNILYDFFNKIRSIKSDPINNAPECLIIQEKLLYYITSAERKVRQARLAADAAKYQLKTKRQPALSKNQAEKLKDSITYYYTRIEYYLNLIHIYREIGDAIAFIYINRWDIKPLSFKESAGFISHKKGARSERRALRYAFNKGLVVILNDLTHCLRYGDITVITIPQEGFALIEIKSSKNRNRRVDNQLQKLQHIASYLATDTTDDLYGENAPYSRHSAHAEIKDYTTELNILISKAKTAGYGLAEVESGLYYLVITEFKEELIDHVIRSFKGSPIVNIVNRTKQNNTAYYPFTLSIFDSESLLAFYEGEFTIMIIIDSHIFLSGFANHGYISEIDWASERPIILHCSEVEQDSIQTISIGNHFLGRIFAEFVSPLWFITEIAHKARQGENLF